MKRLFLPAMFLALVLPANAQTPKEEKHFKAVAAKAGALTMRKCELNDGKKGWTFPNREPIGALPVYRCEAQDVFGEKFATFTQVPDGSTQHEFVELCTSAGMSTKCETVPANRPARRTGDLAKHGVKERKFEEMRCEHTSVGTMPMTMCEPTREKRQ
jgi:hypothetical protein